MSEFTTCDWCGEERSCEDERRALRAERRDLYARQQAVKAQGAWASRLASMAPAYAAVVRGGA